jgi:signal transduction histidine kinase
MRTRGNVNSIVTKDGREREIEWYDAPLTDSGGQLIGLLCMGIDVTERQLLQREVLEIAAEEQRRIGQELHDNTQQQIHGLTLLAQNVAQGLNAIRPVETLDPDRFENLRKNATQVQHGLQEAARQVNLLARGLIPVEIDAQGLKSSLQELASQISRTGNTACIFDATDAVEIDDNYVSTHLFRIAQEAVTNSLKHSRASRIEISLAQADERIILKVIDNGAGFDPDQLTQSGMGLRIMEYRANSIGASLTIDAAVGGGTEVVCSVFAGKRPK